jgi:hypothetical protein
MATATQTQPEASAIISAVIPLAMREQLEQRAHDGDRTLSSEIRRALRNYLEADKSAAA